MESHAKNFKEAVGVLIASFIVVSFVGLGFVQTAVFVFMGKAINFDSDWKISIYGLANIAFGFLIGQKLATSTTPGGVQSTVVENAEVVNVKPAATSAPVATIEKPKDDAKQ